MGMNTRVDKTTSPAAAAESRRQDIEAHLRAMHAQWRRVVLWRGLGRTVVVLVTLVLLACLLDALTHPAMPTRLALSAAVYLCTAVFAWQSWLRFCCRPFSSTSVAWILESVFPSLHERLISAVELPTTPPPGVSLPLIVQTLEEVDEDVQAWQPATVFPMRRSLFRTPAILLACLALAMAMPGWRLPARLARVALPSPRDASPSRHTLVIHPGPRVRDEGDTISFEVKSSTNQTRPVELLLQDQELRRFAMHYDPTRKLHLFEWPKATASFQVWAQTGKIKSRTHAVTVRPRPQVDSFTLTYTFPDYTGLSPTTRQSSTGDLKAWRGTLVELTVHATRPLQAVHLAMPGSEPLVAMAAGQKAASFQLRIERPVDYRLTLVDTQGLANLQTLTYRIVPVADLPPTVLLLEPAADSYLDARDTLALAWEASDDFGLVSQAVVVSFDDGRDDWRQDLPPHQRQFHLPLDTWKIQPGIRLLVTIVATDAIDQQGWSAPRRILIGAGEFMRQVNGYLAGLAKLDTILAQMAQDIEAVDIYSRHIGSLETLLGRGRQHYLLMAQQRLDSLDYGFAMAQQAAASLRDAGFFPLAGYTAELIRLYLEQEQLFVLPEWRAAPPSESAAQRLRQMGKLLAEMTEALQEKGQQHRLSTELALLLDRWRDNHTPHLPGVVAIRLQEAASLLAETTLAAPPSSSPPAKLPEAAEQLAALLEQTASQLEAAAQANQRQLNDNRRLQQAANAIEQELRALESRLREMAADLAAGATPEAWRRVAELAGKYLDLASQDSDAASRADAQLVARALHAAVEARSPVELDAIARTLPILQHSRRLARLEHGIAELRRQVDALDPAADWPPADQPELGRRTQTAADHASQIAAQADAVQALAANPLIRPVAEALAAVTRQLTADADALATSPPSFSQPQATKTQQQIVDNLETATSQLSQLASRPRVEANLARLKLAKNVPDLEQQITSIADALEAAARRLSAPQASLAVVAEAMTTVDRRLAQMASSLTDSIIRDLELAVRPASQLREKAILASRLRTIRSDQLATARLAVTQAAQLPPPHDYETNEKLAAEIAKTLAAATEASDQLRQTAKLASHHTAVSQRRLAPTAEALAQMEFLEAANLPQAMLTVAALDDVARLAEARRQALQLARRTTQENGQPKPAATMDDAVAILADHLAADLTRRAPEALAATARQILGELAAQVDNLLEASRDAKIELAANAPTDRRQQLAATLAAGNQRLAQSLPTADAVNRLATHPLAPLQTEFHASIQANLDLATAMLTTGGDPLPALDNATRGLERLGTRLARLAQAPFGNDHRPTTRPASQDSPTPTDLATVANLIDRLDHHLGTGEAQVRARQQRRDQRQQGRDTARHALAQAAASAPPDLAPQLRRLATDYANLNPAARLAALATAADSLPTLAPERQLLASASTALAQDDRLTTALRSLDAAIGDSTQAALETTDHLQQTTLATQIPTATDQLARLEDNVRLADFAMARRNLTALRQAWRQRPEPPPPSPAWPTRPLAEPPPPPELVDAALAGMDLNARQGVAIELARKTSDGRFAGHAAAIEAAATGNYRLAAQLATGLAANEFAKAAATGQSLTETGEPARFQQVDPPPPALAERRTRRLAEATDLNARLAASQRLAEDVAADFAALQRDYPADRLVEAGNEATRDPLLPPAERQRLSAWLADLATMTPLEQARAARDLATALPPAADRHATRLLRAVERWTDYRPLRETEALFTARKTALTDQVRRLATPLANRQSIAARQAADSLAAAANSATAHDWPPMIDQFKAASRAIASLPPPPPSKRPLNKHAFDGAAIAHALNNQQAMNLAQYGDYQAAADSLERQAAAIPEGDPANRLARTGAQAFRRALQAQGETLSPSLAIAVRQLASQIEQMPVTPVRLSLGEARLAILAGDYIAATAWLDEAMAEPRDPPPTGLAELGATLRDAHRQQMARQAALPAQARRGLAEIASLQEKAELLPAAQLAAARTAILERDYAAANLHLAIAAATASPSFQAGVSRATQAILMADQQEFGTLPDAVKEAIRQLAGNHPDIADLARAGNLSRARELAAQHGQTAAAAYLAQATVAGSPAGKAELLAAMATVDQLANQAENSPLVDPTALRQAREAADNRQFAKAEEKLQAAVGPLLPPAALARDSRRQADRERQIHTAIEAARAAAREHRFAEAIDHLATLPTTSAIHLPSTTLDLLKQADAIAINAADQALAGAYGETLNEATANALQAAANALRAGHRQEAAEQARTAGPAGWQLLEALAGLDSLANVADQAFANLAANADASLANTRLELAKRAQTASRQLDGLAKAALAEAQAFVDQAETLDQADQQVAERAFRKARDLLLGDPAGIVAPTLVASLEQAEAAAAAGEAEPATAAGNAASVLIGEAAKQARRAADAQAEQANALKAEADRLVKLAAALTAGQLDEADQLAAQIAPLAQTALNAASQFQAAAKQTLGPPADLPPPRSATTGRPTLLPAWQAAARPMAQAAAELQMAIGVAPDAVDTAGANHLAMAAERLGEALSLATIAAQQALRPSTGIAAPRPSTFASLADLAPPTGQPWDGPPPSLAGGDQPGTISQYDSYYRHANQRYLEKVARWSRQWNLP